MSFRAPKARGLGGCWTPKRRESVIDGTKHGCCMEDYHVRCQVAAMLYVGGQVKSYEEALKIADSMLKASQAYQG